MLVGVGSFHSTDLEFFRDLLNNLSHIFVGLSGDDGSDSGLERSLSGDNHIGDISSDFGAGIGLSDDSCGNMGEVSSDMASEINFNNISILKSV